MFTTLLSAVIALDMEQQRHERETKQRQKEWLDLLEKK